MSKTETPVVELEIVAIADDGKDWRYKCELELGDKHEAKWSNGTTLTTTVRAVTIKRRWDSE